jgi:hypothetical protein
MRKRSRRPTRIGRAYLDLISVTLKDPPQLSRSDVARMSAELARPRVESVGTTGDLFAPRKQGR